MARHGVRKKVRRDRELHRVSIDTRDFAGRPLDLALDHHLCHMASAYYCSGFDDAVIVSVDGVGDLLSAVIGHGGGTDMRIDRRWFQSQQISGQAYEIVTAMLGFHPDKHPGKVTGLAAYSEPPDELVAEIDRWFRDQYTRGATENWFYRIHQPDEEAQLARLRELRETRFGGWTREEISSAIQHILERDVVALVQAQVPNPESHRVVLAGGVFANVKLNQRIKELGFKGVFVQPAMGDEGTALGAAMLAAHRDVPVQPAALEHAYLGPSFTTAEIVRALDDAGLEYEELARRAPRAAPRRAAPRGHDHRPLPGRDGVRPAGARKPIDPLPRQGPGRQRLAQPAAQALGVHAVRADDPRREGGRELHGIAGAEHTAEFMTITFDATKRMIQESPACVHVDGTARPQLVTERSNPPSTGRSAHYESLSGNASIINTSFNMHEEPIVCTPAEAVKAFQSAHLDALAMGEFLAINPSPEARHRRLAAASA